MSAPVWGLCVVLWQRDVRAGLHQPVEGYIKVSGARKSEAFSLIAP
ncbi:hypothetical protein D4764_13G0002880 [Takifugu flavidus]|uniref:Uncharacterized protein n=1 Tax=Takifugu flavidus TaxID=433684 RepID=A0A5C6P8V6_9TELE|nr:hypothetical protein D4764_13G0002880 [Takifugu flavidus]